MLYDAGGIVGGGLFVLFVWVSIFLFSIEAKPPVLKPKQVTGEVAAEAGQVSAPPSYKEQGDKSRRGSMVKDVNEGLGRPASVAGGDDTTAKNVLSESKKERMRDYLGSEDSVNSYAAALAASTIGSQTSSFDRPYSVNNKRDSAASTNFNRRQDSFSRRDSQASMSSETALYKDSVQPLGRSHRFRDSGSSITLRGQGEIPESARSQGTVIV